MSTKHVHLKMRRRGGIAKLMPKYIGPFKVIERLGSVAYRLALFPNSSMHPVFHVSLLSAYHTDASHEWRWVCGRPQLFYLVHWDGFSHDNDTTELAGNLFQASAPVAPYRARSRRWW